MIIKCPQCSTGYNIPEKLVADKPRKMRCTRCQNIFTIARRAVEAPRGYEEFTGRQHLPDEFAFLREAPKEEVPTAEQPAEQPPAEPPPDGLYESVAGAAADQTDTIPLEPKVVSGPTREPAPPPPAAEQAPPPPAVEQAPPPPEAEQAHPPPEAEQAHRASSSSDIYGASSAWEMEAPLELGGYAIADEATTAEGTGGQAVGKFMTAIVVLVVVFFVFVAWRNDWSIALSDLPDQIAFAFSGEGGEAIADEARDIEVTIANRRLVTADDKAKYLVVTGTVFNADTVGRAEVVLRGRLLDLVGEVRDEARGPCGKVIEDQAIEATASGAIGGHFREGGSLFNCTIKPEGDNVFQLIFEDVPLDYSSDFTLEIEAVAASVYLPG